MQGFNDNGGKVCLSALYIRFLVKASPSRILSLNMKRIKRNNILSVKPRRKKSVCFGRPPLLRKSERNKTHISGKKTCVKRSVRYFFFSGLSLLTLAKPRLRRVHPSLSRTAWDSAALSHHLHPSQRPLKCRGANPGHWVSQRVTVPSQEESTMGPPYG